MDNLIGAYLAKRRWSESASDLRDHHARRYAALAAALGADLESPPSSGAGAPASRPSWYSEGSAVVGPHGAPTSWLDVCRGQEFALASLFRSTVHKLEQLGSPFDGYLEAPPVIGAFYRQHAQEIRAPLDDARNSMRVLLRDVTCTLWSLDPEATVSADALRAHGFEPDEPAPDPLDYF